MAHLYSPMVIFDKPSKGRMQNHRAGSTHAAMNDRADYSDIGQRLLAVRTHFSSGPQKEWAAKNGFAQNRYNQWERGTRRIPVDAAETLCERYGLTLDFIYRGRRDGLSATLSNAL